MSEFQQAARLAKEPGTRAAFTDALESAAQTTDIDAVGARIIKRAPKFGVISWRHLAFDLCVWAEGRGILDDLFPLDEMVDGGE